MSRITHCSYFPLNIDYWDYYILCGLNIEAARILQRLEFWDGTRGEDSHDGASPQTPGTSSARFIWKTEEELAWELMGSCGEKRLAACLRFLIHDRQYVVSRANPAHRFDRTKQYAVQVQRIQEHLNKLDALIKTFINAGRRLRPVQYAIELLTRKGISIEALTVEQIADQLAELHHAMQEQGEHQTDTSDRQKKAHLPMFIRLHLQKDETEGFCAVSPLSKTTVSIPQNDGIESPNARHPDQQDASLDGCNGTGTIPENTSENPSTSLQTEQMQEAEAQTVGSLHEAIPAASVSLRTEDSSNSPIAATPSVNASETGMQQTTGEAHQDDMTAEDIVSLFEQKQGKACDENTRPVQLTSARTLLNLHLPLTADILARVYDECCDDWWREHYGTLHVSHLVERERHGQLRIVRLMHRVQTKAKRMMHPPEQPTNSRPATSGLPPGATAYPPDVLHSCTITGSNTPCGWTGWASSPRQFEPVRLVQWNGTVVPLDDALKDGYHGGWERFRSHESDDLDALVQKYQQQGILPHTDTLNEGANRNEPYLV